MPSPVNYSNFLKRELNTINNQSHEKQLTHIKQCTTFGIPDHQLLHKLSLLSTKRVFEPNHDSCLIYFTKVKKKIHVHKTKPTLEIYVPYPKELSTQAVSYVCNKRSP